MNTSGGTTSRIAKLNAVSLNAVSLKANLKAVSVVVGCFFVLSFFAVEAIAQDGEISGGDIRRVVTARSPMTKSLGGGQAGELYLNTKVRVIEERGAWTKIATEGWVRKNSLSEPTAASGSAAPAPVDKPKIVQGALRVTEFIRSSRSDVSPPREYIVLTVTNDSPRTIRSWAGLLVALDEKETSIFREQVSEENIEWKPSESRDVTFFWQPAEAGYSKIQQVTSGEHRVMILNVEMQ